MPSYLRGNNFYRYLFSRVLVDFAKTIPAKFNSRCIRKKLILGKNYQTMFPQKVQKKVISLGLLKNINMLIK